MIETATVHKDSLLNVAKNRSLVYRPNRTWPLNDNCPRGVGRGVLIPVTDSNLLPSPLTVGVFERASSLYDLAWKEYKGSCLSAWIGENGRDLKKAVVLEEIARLQKLYNYEYTVTVEEDESLTITIERK